MAKVYYDLIVKSLKAIDDVPLRWRGDTQALLDADSTM